VVTETQKTAQNYHSSEHNLHYRDIERTGRVWAVKMTEAWCFIGGRETTALEGTRRRPRRAGTARHSKGRCRSLSGDQPSAFLHCMLRIVDIRTIFVLYSPFREEDWSMRTSTTVQRRAEARGNSSPSMGIASFACATDPMRDKRNAQDYRADRRRVAMDAASFSKTAKAWSGESRVFRKTLRQQSKQRAACGIPTCRLAIRYDRVVTLGLKIGSWRRQVAKYRNTCYYM